MSHGGCGPGQGGAGAAAAQADADPGAAFRRSGHGDREGCADVIRLTLDSEPAEGPGSAGARPRRGARVRIFRSRIIAVDNASGDVLARVGSPDYFDDRRAGQVDMTRAVRSPGSTLKPFIYGLAFEDGFVHPESLIDDRPIRFGSYAPRKFRHDVSGHGAGAQGAAAVAERAGDRAARSRRRQPAVVAAEAGGRQSGAAEGRGAGSGHGSRRRRRHAAGSGAALLRAGAARQYAAAARDRRKRRIDAIRCG